MIATQNVGKLARLLKLSLVGFWLMASFIFSSCQRGGDSSSANSKKVSIDTKALHKKMSSIEASTPPIEELCFGAELNGSEIPVQLVNQTCSLSLGVAVGFQLPGTELSLQVPQGSHRILNIYALKRPSGGVCSDYKEVLQKPENLRKIYRIATVQDLDLVGLEKQIDITPTFPGIGNHLLSTQKWSPACLAAANPQPSGMKVVLARATVVNDFGSMKVRIASKGVSQ